MGPQLPRPGIKPTFLTLEGGFLTTQQPRKPSWSFLIASWFFISLNSVICWHNNFSSFPGSVSVLFNQWHIKVGMTISKHAFEGSKTHYPKIWHLGMLNTLSWRSLKVAFFPPSPRLLFPHLSPLTGPAPLMWGYPSTPGGKTSLSPRGEKMLQRIQTNRSYNIFSVNLLLITVLFMKPSMKTLKYNWVLQVFTFFLKAPMSIM